MDTSAALNVMKQLQYSGRFLRWGQEDEAVQGWYLKVVATLKRTLGADHPHTEMLEFIWSRSPASSDWLPKARAILDASIFELEELADPLSSAPDGSIDEELWEHVRHLVSQEPVSYTHLRAHET